MPSVENLNWARELLSGISGSSVENSLMLSAVEFHLPLYKQKKIFFCPTDVLSCDLSH